MRSGEWAGDVAIILFIGNLVQSVSWVCPVTTQPTDRAVNSGRWSEGSIGGKGELKRSG